MTIAAGGEGGRNVGLNLFIYEVSSICLLHSYSRAQQNPRAHASRAHTVSVSRQHGAHRGSRRGKTTWEKMNKEMDKEFAPEPEFLLTFIRRLKEVFDVCDEDSDGFICAEHLMQLGSRFGQREQVRKHKLGLFKKCTSPWLV